MSADPRMHRQGAGYTQHKHQTTHKRWHAWPRPNVDKSQSNHKAPPESPYPVTKVSCQILTKYFLMFAPFICFRDYTWMWARSTDTECTRQLICCGGLYLDVDEATTRQPTRQPPQDNSFTVGDWSCLVGSHAFQRIEISRISKF